MVEVFVNQSGAELSFQDGGTHERVAMFKNSLNRGLVSWISMVTRITQKCHATSKWILTVSCGPKRLRDRVVQSITGYDLIGNQSE